MNPFVDNIIPRTNDTHKDEEIYIKEEGESLEDLKKLLSAERKLRAEAEANAELEFEYHLITSVNL